MLEIFVWGLILWMVSSFIIGMFVGARRESNQPLSIDKLPSNAVVLMPIYMEQIRDWWYGWFISDEGVETFIGQGKTYDEALHNCKKRVQERNPDLKITYKFEMKNASPTVQS